MNNLIITTGILICMITLTGMQNQLNSRILFQRQLHSGQVRLCLPAAVVGTVVCQMYKIAHYSHILVLSSYFLLH